MRSESGASSMHASARPQGELYEKWKLKRRREINDDVSGEDDGNSAEKKDYRKVHKTPRLRVNSDVKEELRSKDQIKKLAKKRENLKLKNMEKGKRRVIENKQRAKKKAAQQKQLLASRRR